MKLNIRSLFSIQSLRYLPTLGLALLGVLGIPSSSQAAWFYSDTDFIKTAAMGGMTEVELGKLAREKGSTYEVRRFGAMMVKDHSMLNKDVKVLAAKKGIELPRNLDKKHQSKVDELSSKSGKDFDSAYLASMEKAHNKDQNLFQEAQRKTKDAWVKRTTDKALPVINGHIAHLEHIEEGRSMAHK